MTTVASSSIDSAKPGSSSPLKAGSAPVCVIILTFNEVANIERCLKSLEGFAQDIVIVDSQSTDGTLEICERFGCRVFQHQFHSQATQFNWALDNVEISQPWILRLDADEWLADGIKRELTDLSSQSAPELTGIFLNRRIYFMSHWLRYGGMYPHYILRMFRQGAGRYENKTEEHLILSHGTTVRASYDFAEDNRQNTLKYWLRKHDNLSDREIRDTLMETSAPGEELEPSLWGTKGQRTRWLKLNVYVRSPLFLRAFLYFIYRYILRLGFLDGMPGLIFHVLQGFWYRFYIDARIYEERSRWQEVRVDDNYN